LLSIGCRPHANLISVRERSTPLRKDDMPARRALKGAAVSAALVCALALPSAALGYTQTFFGYCTGAGNAGAHCIASERHTYDDDGSTDYSTNSRYISSYLQNPSTGTVIAYAWGAGYAYQWWSDNNNIWVDAYVDWWTNQGPGTAKLTAHY
jgi:hypothetical protein